MPVPKALYATYNELYKQHVPSIRVINSLCTSDGVYLCKHQFDSLLHLSILRSDAKLHAGRFLLNTFPHVMCTANWMVMLCDQLGF